jgi:hypothetical protein
VSFPARFVELALATSHSLDRHSHLVEYFSVLAPKGDTTGLLQDHECLKDKKLIQLLQDIASVRLVPQSALAELHEKSISNVLKSNCSKTKALPGVIGGGPANDRTKVVSRTAPFLARINRGTLTHLAHKLEPAFDQEIFGPEFIERIIKVEAQISGTCTVGGATSAKTCHHSKWDRSVILLAPLPLGAIAPRKSDEQRRKSQLMYPGNIVSVQFPSFLWNVLTERDGTRNIEDTNGNCVPG